MKLCPCVSYGQDNRKNFKDSKVAVSTSSEQHDRADSSSSSAPQQSLQSAFAQTGARFKRNDSGEVDVMDAVGGVRGILEAILPGFIFLCVFLVAENLYIALAVAGGIALVFALARVVQRGSLIQSMSGFIGVLICAWSAWRTGDAADYYLPGLWMNLGYGVAILFSIIFRWPVLGFFYSFIRNEAETWRANPQRLKIYTRATWVFFAMFMLRLLVQVPLYLADNVAYLGVSRLFMGIPLYISILWLTWMMTRKPEDVAYSDVN